MYSLPYTTGWKYDGDHVISSDITSTAETDVQVLMTMTIDRPSYFFMLNLSCLVMQNVSFPQQRANSSARGEKNSRFGPKGRSTTRPEGPKRHKAWRA